MIHKAKMALRELGFRNAIVGRFYLLASRAKVAMLSNLDDRSYAHMHYTQNTGKALNLDKPTTFNEKLWWLKLNNRDPLLTRCSDKSEVRKYIAELGLEHLLVKQYGVYDAVHEVNFDDIPDKAFIKTTHGSGTNIVFDRSKSFDRKKFVRTFGAALRRNYYLQSREWNYKNIKPRIIIEEFLEDPSFVDYKILCFDGKPKIIFVDMDLTLEDGKDNPFARRNVYDEEFNLLDLRVGKDNFDPSLVEKPDNLDEMMRYAEIIAEPFPHCRVDLYNVRGKVYFGEITFYNGGGCERVTPECWDRKLGEWIDLQSKKIVLGTAE